MRAVLGAVPRWLGFGLAGILAQACSYFWVTPPPEPSVPGPPGPVSCTSSGSAPATDIALAVGTVVATSVLLVLEEDSDPQGEEGPPGPPPGYPIATASVGAALTTLLVFSGAYGVRNTKSCRKLQRSESAPSPAGTPAGPQTQAAKDDPSPAQPAR